jgi:hypothetical protein
MCRNGETVGLHLKKRRFVGWCVVHPIAHPHKAQRYTDPYHDIEIASLVVRCTHIGIASNDANLIVAYLISSLLHIT